MLEAEHGAVRSIYSRLRYLAQLLNYRLIAASAVRTSNELYGSGTMSLFDLILSSSNPIDATCLSPLFPSRLIAAHQNFVVQRKLTLVLRFKSQRTPESNP